MRRETTSGFANNKGTHQLAYLQLVSVAEQAGLNLTEDKFSPIEAPIRTVGMYRLLNC